MNNREGIGRLDCRMCGASYQMPIHHLHEPIDVFSEWLDDCENAERQNGVAPDGGDGEQQQQDDLDDGDDDDLGEESGLHSSSSKKSSSGGGKRDRDSIDDGRQKQDLRTLGLDVESDDED
uniref:Transcription elongation factor 1 homolog n=2 Tax=Proboscia inermis TaxID=420281 RepID=A0A7S0GD82_9STRA|mmetsp:Transcript_14745/g.17019  ORF Transcript_14745/g.17019 Transcript_14745/m.17019 type:complete len:121 (-) Transcript_14745:466-828(-)|eukprot:CAMPEP_0171322900 /NCGR_PEP_ID=MMETSP0816-20121228/115239_1 /TAXON_ID=420281 /ORGANISM="Proboscia inermis, Strain CCAP1064/1" /LENGTH=120 /DNA_ID=CAMNT_0011821475 /DNA_START=220 /DNA_END=582 /DNA_ORIENTATION=-